MGRSRKPSAQLERNGSFDKHPERRRARAGEPKPVGPLGDVPLCFTTAGGLSEYMATRLTAIWNEVVAEAPPGVCTWHDRKHVELICRLLYRVRTGGAKSGDFSRLDTLLGKIGMNPADRSKVNVVASAAATSGDDATENSPFNDLAAEPIPGRPN